MLNQFDDAFYRNKRSALVSSLALIGAVIFSLHIGDGKGLYFLKVDNIANSTVVAIVLVVCVYLNCSYYLQYFTEIPAWMRNPDSGLQKVDDLIGRLQELKDQVANEQTAVFRFRDDANKALSEISERAGNLNPSDLPRKLEDQILNRLKIAHGDIHAATFNQLSSAIRSSKLDQSHLNWSDMTDTVIATAREKLVGVFVECYNKMLEDVRTDINRFLTEANQKLDEARTAEDHRLLSLAASNRSLLGTERRLRIWQTAMSWRLRVQYLYLPILLFFVAMVVGVDRLVCGNFTCPSLPDLWSRVSLA